MHQTDRYKEKTEYCACSSPAIQCIAWHLPPRYGLHIIRHLTANTVSPSVLGTSGLARMLPLTLCSRTPPPTSSAPALIAASKRCNLSGSNRVSASPIAECLWLKFCQKITTPRWQTTEHLSSTTVPNGNLSALWGGKNQNPVGFVPFRQSVPRSESHAPVFTC